MPQSYVQLFVHIVFHTKNNQKLIGADIDTELHAYIGGVLRNYNSLPIQVGGTMDHIHVLCTLPKTMSLSDLVEEIKKSSSKWIKTKGEAYRSFYWQDGYGGFSVSKSGVEIVTKYILSQKTHHYKESFLDEYKKLLKSFGISFDERYL